VCLKFSFVIGGISSFAQNGLSAKGPLVSGISTEMSEKCSGLASIIRRRMHRSLLTLFCMRKLCWTALRLRKSASYWRTFSGFECRNTRRNLVVRREIMTSLL